MKKTTGYAPINGLKMYFEIEGDGDPLVFIPPAFGFAGLKSFTTLAKFSCDPHGRSSRARSHRRYCRPPALDQQHADDVVALLKHLDISRADFLGESYGGRHSGDDRRAPSQARTSRGDLFGTFPPPPSTLNP